ncbi:MAG: hypothetical protein HYR96_10855 [Deltaproteobacteria bacterium]|nr:hypothetical protein [Deltaproteobacteria bacterium]MBI3293611.1 hypothetical protein [Deltaproteobacteria bacterium]
MPDLRGIWTSGCVNYLDRSHIATLYISKSSIRRSEEFYDFENCKAFRERYSGVSELYRVLDPYMEMGAAWTVEYQHSPTSYGIAVVVSRDTVIFSETLSMDSSKPGTGPMLQFRRSAAGPK